MQNAEGYVNKRSIGKSENDAIQYLMKLGVTRIQANLYLKLMLYGEADARLLSSWTNLPRTEIYRTLRELQEKGLVDRQVGAPLKFTAVPPRIGLQALIESKSSEIVQMEKALKVFTRDFGGQQEQQRCKKNYQISVIEGRKRIIDNIKRQLDLATTTVDIVSFLPRFLVIANETALNYRKAIDRGVRYRLIIGLPNENQKIPEEMQRAHNNKYTVLKTVVGNQRINSSIFDGAQTNFSYFPDRPITESPMVVSDHPSLVAFAQNYFEQLWKTL